ncbi:MAG: aquaporin [Patescibacteria group bacterium]
MKKYIAELIGAFALTLTVSLSLVGTFPIATPLLAALTLGLFVYSIGHISGAHINPAVTLGAWSIKKISTQNALAYMLAQFVGASIAMTIMAYTVGTPSVTSTLSWAVFFAELIGTFFFTFGIASVIYEKTPSVASGAVIGGSLLLGIAIAAHLGANGILNPAVAFGIGSFNFAYILGPLVGSVLGMQAYRKLL